MCKIKSAAVVVFFLSKILCQIYKCGRCVTFRQTNRLGREEKMGNPTYSSLSEQLASLATLTTSQQAEQELIKKLSYV